MSNLLSLMYFSITSNNLSSFCSCCSILLASTSILLASWSNLSATRSIFSSSTNGTGSAVIVLKYLLGKGFNEQLIGFSSASICCNCQKNGHPEADSFAVMMFTVRITPRRFHIDYSWRLSDSFHSWQIRTRNFRFIWCYIWMLFYSFYAR